MPCAARAFMMPGMAVALPADVQTAGFGSEISGGWQSVRCRARL
eukprot:SAG11_NODE_24063_length_378_cov_2.229391_1_plen_43_part_10